ncbi:uncharacterized protein BDCG_17309 [Blastomyces dermatitidis ER-3]|uniref:Uncharacterized protein n=1 Tax=Ajellomyces dermatitidis (strain ER-3 / ATCC MYA-2586) TaxID=559297 RepID=A0ABX2VYP7_AJEDR|nr:uncharacterized protein BDCG_17309 [Blastomyces dermatitidis ER-3]OAT01953.1 hypothetical protein BDCG_17309 [Blastomyces dermatitidis ER-3]
MTSVSLVRVSELQVLTDFIKAEEVSLAHLQKEVKQIKMSVSETSTVKNEFDESVIIDE